MSSQPDLTADYQTVDPTELTRDGLYNYLTDLLQGVDSQSLISACLTIAADAAVSSEHPNFIEEAAETMEFTAMTVRTYRGKSLH